jgi:hypothetical protein
MAGGRYSRTASEKVELTFGERCSTRGMRQNAEFVEELMEGNKKAETFVSALEK